MEVLQPLSGQTRGGYQWWGEGFQLLCCFPRTSRVLSSPSVSLLTTTFPGFPCQRPGDERILSRQTRSYGNRERSRWPSHAASLWWSHPPGQPAALANCCTTLTMSSRHPTGVLRNFCLRRPKAQSGVILVWPTSMKLISMCMLGPP